MQKFLPLARSCFFLALLIMLIGCEAFVSVPVPIPTATVVAASPVPPPVAITPTPSPTASETPSTTPTPFLTSTPTATPRPTLAPTQASALVIDLYQHNANCKLPCWWGVVPGKTKWLDAQAFFETFALKIVYGTYKPNIVEAAVFVPVPPSIWPGSPQNYFDISDEKVVTIQTEFLDVPAYRMAQIFQTYGVPDQIWIDPRRLQFPIALFYPRLGILAVYNALTSPGGETIAWCNKFQNYTTLYLWAPTEPITFAQAINDTDFGPSNTYRPLSETTKLDTKSFFATFSNPNNQTCLETPAALWPPG